MTTSPRDPADALPVPSTLRTDADRPYLTIRPTDVPLDSTTFARALNRCLSHLRPQPPRRLRDRFRSDPEPPVLEFLAASSGGRDPVVRYHVGCSDPEVLDAVKISLRRGIPTSYEIGSIDWHPRRLEDHWRTSTNQAVGDREVPAGGVVYGAEADHHRDWQFPLATDTEFLTSILETQATTRVPTLFQLVAHPFRDWTDQAHRFTRDLERGRLTVVEKLWDEVFLPEPGTHEVTPTDREQIQTVADRDPTRTFQVSARAVVIGEPAGNSLSQFQHVVTSSGSAHHRLMAQIVDDGPTLFAKLCDRLVEPVEYGRLRNRITLGPSTSRGMVVASDELVPLCGLDGESLTTVAHRSLATRSLERRGLPRPLPEQLARFGPPGQAVGMPLDIDRQPVGRPFHVQPSDQDRHLIVIGPTGSGKSILVETAVLTNVTATDGPEIILDYKGGSTSTEYLQAHFAAFGHLDDVVYFDCTRVLPALSILDIGPLLDADIPREEARSRIAGHYEEMVAALMGPERFWQAVEAPKAIRNHLRALFDPVNGMDAVSNTNLFHALARTQRDGAPPAVADDRLADYFASLLDRDRDVFNRILGGALNRVETIATDGRLAPMFDHVPRGTDPRFDFADVIDESKVVIFDFGGMEDRAKRAITLALFSNLWRALQARAIAADPDESLPLVNLYLEEAGAVGESALLDTLLSQGRSFGLSVMLGVQFLGQLDSPDPESRTYEEALNETATIIAGQVAQRDDLVYALATDTMSPDDVDRRLSRLPRGEWLIRPGTAFGVESIPPFLMESLPAPPGHPVSDEPLSAAALDEFESAFERVRSSTAEGHGLRHDDESAARRTGGVVEEDADRPAAPRLDTAYPHSKRMPPTVAYNPEAHALMCLLCDNVYDPDSDGMRRAIECHSSIEAVDRDDVPIGALNIKRPPDERAEDPLTDHQFMFLQAVYDAMQSRVDPLEYDLRRDSMIRLQEYVGIEPDEVQAVIDEDLLRKDTDHPHRLYSVTRAGRGKLGESYREGVDYGHGKGDLEESSPHVMGVLLGVEYLERFYVEDDESPVVEIQAYYDIGSNQRLDAAGLDERGDIVVTLEMERVNHDIRRAVPDDFDKMAACDPEEALWIVMSHSEGHEVYDALKDPLDGEARVTKSYSDITPVSDFRIDEPGFTAMLTVGQLQRKLGL